LVPDFSAPSPSVRIAEDDVVLVTLDSAMASFVNSGGVSYLREMLDVVPFPEIWSLQTEL